MRVAVTLEQCWHRVPGGTARAALDLVAAMQDLEGVGSDLNLVGLAARHKAPPPEPWVPSIPVEHLPIPRLLMYEGWHHLGWPHVEDATGRIDVIHATGVAVPPRSVPLVVTVHDLAVLHDPSTFTRRGVSFMRRAIELTRQRADLVLCSSQATLDDCIANDFDPDRLRLVPLGVSAAAAPDLEVERVRAAYSLPARFALFVGTLEPRKNLSGLLAAHAQLAAEADIDLVLVGPEGWGDHGGGVGSGPGGGARVRSLGFVPQADLAPLYAAAEVFCYPSLLEGFGLPVLEAMAQGTPVVTSTGTATEELVAAGGGVAVDPRDPDAIAAGMLSVLHGDRPLLVDQARAIAAEYSWDRTAELTLAAYRELVP